MKNIPKIKLSDITTDKLKNIRDGYKIFDTDTGKYYEKVHGQFQEMIEENGNTPPEHPKTDYSASAAAIDEMVKTGNKLKAANMLMQIKTTKNELISQKDMVNQKINFMFNGILIQCSLRLVAPFPKRTVVLSQFLGRKGKRVVGTVNVKDDIFLIRSVWNICF